MSDITTTEYDPAIEAKASTPAPVRSFTIYGLYGYRTVSIHSPHSATVLIARNGAGKTTLISALYAILVGQFSRLRDIDFSYLVLELKDLDPVTITSQDIEEYFNFAEESEISKQARKMDIDPFDFFRFLMEDYPHLKGNYRALHDHPIYNSIQRFVGYNTMEVDDFLESLSESDEVKSTAIYSIYQTIEISISNYDVIYLPTYRRIELPLSRTFATRKRRKRPGYAMRNIDTSALVGDIQFGLQDISDHLEDLNRQILFDSGFGYRRISADIISEMIQSDLDGVTSETTAIPQADELSLFFSRLKESRHNGPFLDDMAIPNIELAYETSSKPTDSGKFLKYFLGKLNSVIQETKTIEQSVQSFVESCNKYLSSQDISTSVKSDRTHPDKTVTPDDKVLILNRQNLAVHAESLIGNRVISLDALSSGEKQMISLFAKLYLYEKEKIVLIDEPELSLSLDWQRQILTDVLRAPLCAQIIAITHSPFVFDNELEPYARALEIDVDLSALPSDSQNERKL